MEFGTAILFIVKAFIMGVFVGVPLGWLTLGMKQRRRQSRAQGGG